LRAIESWGVKVRIFKVWEGYFKIGESLRRFCEVFPIKKEKRQ
jgi:hypothetical protein